MRAETRDEDPGHRAARVADAIALIFALVLLGAHVSWIDEPWDNSHLLLPGPHANNLPHTTVSISGIRLRMSA